MCIAGLFALQFGAGRFSSNQWLRKASSVAEGARKTTASNREAEEEAVTETIKSSPGQMLGVRGASARGRHVSFDASDDMEMDEVASSEGKPTHFAFHTSLFILFAM